MKTFRLKYVKSMKDRHGKERHYYNRPGYPKTPLPGAPGSPEFMKAYLGVAGGQEPPKTIVVGAGRVVAGSLGALLAEYYQSATWRSLKEHTQANYRNLLERFAATTIPDTKLTCRDAMVKDFRPAHIARIMDVYADTPGLARNMRLRINKLFKFSIKREYRDTNPVQDTEAPKPKSRQGFIAWSQADIDAFFNRWEYGSKPWLAMMILYRTAVRRSDLVRLGRQHVVETDHGKELHFRTVKGNQWMEIPIDRELEDALATVPVDQMLFVQTEYGKQFSDAGFTKWFRERAEMAGVHGRTPHGVRKAADRELAEAGSTPHEIGAIDGHTTLKEVERYTRSANRTKMAWSAVRKREAEGLKKKQKKSKESNGTEDKV